MNVPIIIQKSMIHRNYRNDFPLLKIISLLVLPANDDFSLSSFIFDTTVLISS